MEKAGVIVRDALAELMSSQPEQTLKPVDFNTGVRYLNRMLDSWAASGISLGTSRVHLPEDYLDIPDAAVSGVVFNLAIDLANRFGYPISSSLAVSADKHYKSIVRLFSVKPSSFSGNLPRGSGNAPASESEFAFYPEDGAPILDDSGECRALEIIQSNTPPANPKVGTLWLDTSKEIDPVDLEGEISLLKQAISIKNSGNNAKNVAIAPQYNFIDEGVSGSVICGIGWSVFPNKIGFAAKPLGTDGTNAAEWTLDSGYASATINDASVATINGGYDHINNQIAGTICGGGHNFIQYNAGGHSFIGGGSYNWIQAGRSTIVAGTNNRIAGQVHNNILGGFTNKILNGSYHFILSGKDNVINTTDDTTSISCAIIGRNNSITGVSKDNIVVGRFNTSNNDESCIILGGTGHNLESCFKSAAVGGNELDLNGTQYSAVIGGDDITMNGANYSFSAGGFRNVQSGRSSAMIAAEECDDKGTRGIFTGRMAEGMNAIYQIVLGARHPSYLSGLKTQAMRVVQAATTTGTSDNAPADQQIIVGNTGYTNVVGTCCVTARNVTDGKSAAYKIDFVAEWNGTTYYINGSASDAAMTLIYQNISSNIAAPTLAFSAGALRVRFGGTTGKTIHWSAFLDVVVQRIT